jgi:hypothetical protein
LQSGVAQSGERSGFRPNTGARFHPEGFGSQQVTAAHHRYSARRNIATCASCHREKDCVACHGTQAIGRGGFSPHPVGFASSPRCRTIGARNGRVCLKCHSKQDVLLRCR